MIRRRFLAAALGVLAFSCAPRADHRAPAHLAALDPSLEALRARFNEHADEVRLVALLSPT